MKATHLLIGGFLLIGILSVNGNEAQPLQQQEDNSSNNKTTAGSAAAVQLNVTTTAASLSTTASSSTQASSTAEAGKDKRQIGSKDTQVFANHRSDTNVADADGSDDPESPQETVYGSKPTQQFLIRPISAQQQQQQQQQLQQQQQQQQQQQHFRNYPATIRPHGTQLLEQSQEIQHFAYLQELSRNQPKASAAAAQFQGKPLKKAARLLNSPPSLLAQSQQRQQQYVGEEADQRYAIAIRNPYHLAALQQQQQQQQQQPHQHQHQQQQQQQQPQPPYQIIPEEQFLKLLEEELQARAYEEQYRQQQEQEQQQQQQQQQQQHHHQQQQQQQHQQQEQQQLQQEQAADAAAAAATKPPPPPPLGPQHRPGALGLGGYRQRLNGDEQPQQELVQYVPRHRGGPKYLPLQQQQPQPHPHHHHQQQQQQQQQLQPEQYLEAEAEPQLPPQIAYYQPQITSYKALPNHPLAKSSLEKEIEKLLATNKPSVAALQIVDSTNEPSVNQHQQAAPHLRYTRPPTVAAAAATKTTFVASSTPNSLLDANNQPFVPSLFRFSSYQPPMPIYPTQLPQKLGPVVYPTSPNANAQPAPTAQYYYQEADAQPLKPKAFRAKQYGSKIAPGGGAPKPREKAAPKYAQQQQQLVYEFEAQPQGPPQHGQQFYPSPPDPIHSKSTQSPPAPTAPAPTAMHDAALTPPADFRQYVLPAPAPSQSSIYVSQGTGIATQSRPLPPHRATHKSAAKTVDDVKQLHLPQPGGKPLTQAEFQALIDAGYPVTAVPVPVPVPYEQFFKDHPEYRNQRAPLDYAQLMRFDRAGGPHAQQRSLAAASEPERAVKIISTPSDDGQTASAIGGGSVTYLRPIHGSDKRRTRDEKETAVAGELAAPPTAQL